VTALQEGGEVTNLFAITGSGGQANSGFMVMTLAPWDERARSQQEIAADINARLRGVIGVRAFALQPNSLRIRGAGQGLRFALVGASYDDLSRDAATLVSAMEQNPAFGQVRLGYDTTQPQLFIEVDRARAADLGIRIEGLGEALQAVLDGRSVGTVFIGDKSHDVQLISTADPVNDPSDLERVFMRSATGQTVPISSFVRWPLSWAARRSSARCQSPPG
jgi:HAE1 family hydrophobic/amphiphilic exporter-1